MITDHVENSNADKIESNANKSRLRREKRVNS